VGLWASTGGGAASRGSDTSGAGSAATGTGSTTSTRGTGSAGGGSTTGSLTVASAIGGAPAASTPDWNVGMPSESGGGVIGSESGDG